MKKIFKLLLVFFFLTMPLTTRAATTLYFDPAQKEVGLLDTFSIDLRIDTAGECINTIEGEIELPRDLELKDFMIGESIINIWVDAPKADQVQKINDDGLLRFSGGIPGGYCGSIKGDPGMSNIVGRLIFATPKSMDSDFKKIKINFLGGTKVYLNDGLGTLGELVNKNAEITLLQNRKEKDNGLDTAMKNDNILPEPFMVEFYKSNKLFNGKYYIIFNTVDKQSGVDHYEILEIRSEEEIGGKTSRNFVDYLMSIKRSENVQWKKADMPYVLEDQSLQSIVRVKAVDKVGNERIVEYIPPTQAKEEIRLASKRKMIVVLLWGAGAALLGAVVIIVRKILKRKANI